MIRAARLDEGPRLKEIAIAAKSHWGYERARVLRWADDGDFSPGGLAKLVVFVAEAEGVVVGSVRFWIVAGVCVIRLLSVSPAHQSQGIGKALIREIELVATNAHKFFACTMLRTARNIHLFMSLGYKAESILPDHYNHLDLICFAKYRESMTNATPSPT